MYGEDSFQWHSSCITVQKFLIERKKVQKLLCYISCFLFSLCLFNKIQAFLNTSLGAIDSMYTNQMTKCFSSSAGLSSFYVNFFFF